MSVNMSVNTPMIRQYLKIKKRYPDAILFFRLGDFYEMFFEDAHIASKILGITLTSRNKSEKGRIPMCGVPYHSSEHYVSKLLKHGYKVAICEQVEDPKLAKGIVERRVVKVLTPGVILDVEKLDSKSNNFLAGLFWWKGYFGLAYTDISTGEFKTTSFSSVEDLKDELSNLEPKEILIPKTLPEKDNLVSFFAGSWNPLVTVLEGWIWDVESAEELLKECLGLHTLDALGLREHPESIVACGSVIYYLKETQLGNIPVLDIPLYYERSQYMLIDEFTKRNLELFGSIRGSLKRESLLGVLDETLTPMGGRLLKHWIAYPLLNIDAINERLESVEELRNRADLRKRLRDRLKEIGDIERLIGRITTTSVKPRDLGTLRYSLDFIRELKQLLEDSGSKLLLRIQQEMDSLKDIKDFLDSALSDELPLSIRDGGVIREGFNRELDELRAVKQSGRRWIVELEAREKRSTGIGSLKVGYNQVFGYYIEVTKPNLHLVPSTYIRKQTLANAERFITPELKEYEERIVNAHARIIELESELFGDIRKRVATECDRIRRTAHAIAQLDVLSSFSEVASRCNYSRPEINTSGTLEIKAGRHPVVERMDLGEGFVPNDVKLDREENQVLIITGPNMAGKSTLIRQVALIVLMAQIGSFVPADHAKVGIVDRIFTRVGASDNLARGQSTFMVEMIETAYILRHATRDSLVILDEIGRGTSTFDGISIAWAVAEFLHDLGCKTLFATHFHELSQLAVSRRRVKNYNVFVKEDGDKIVFARKLVPGAVSHSYGIQVARLAGVPEKVLKTANRVLMSLEKTHSRAGGRAVGSTQLSLFERFDKNFPDNTLIEVLKEIKNIEPLTISPLEALSRLIEIKRRLEDLKF